MDTAVSGASSHAAVRLAVVVWHEAIANGLTREAHRLLRFAERYATDCIAVDICVVPPQSGVEIDVAAADAAVRQCLTADFRIVSVAVADRLVARGLLHTTLDRHDLVNEFLRPRGYDVVLAPAFRCPVYYALWARACGLAYETTSFVLCVGDLTATQPSRSLKLPSSVLDLFALSIEHTALRKADGLLFDSVATSDTALRRYNLPLPHQGCYLDGVGAGAKGPSRDDSGANAFADEFERNRHIAFVGEGHVADGVDVFVATLEELRRSEPETRASVYLTACQPDIAARLDRTFATLGIQPSSARSFEEIVDGLKADPGVVLAPARYTSVPLAARAAAAAGVPALLGAAAEAPAHRDGSPVGRAVSDYRIFRDVLLGTRAAEPADGATAAAPSPLPDRLRGLIASPAGAERRVPDALVSVVVSHFNRGDLLRQALRSLEEQTYRNLEIVIVDDGSTDPDSLAVLDELEAADHPFPLRCLRQTNAYPGAARNRGVEQAKGEFILFMDDDNVAFPEEVEKLMHALHHADAEIAVCFRENFTGMDYPARDTVHSRLLLLGPSLSAGVFHNTLGDTNFLIRRSAFERVGRFTEFYGVGKEDYEFLLRCTAAELRFAVVPEPLFFYRELGNRIRTGHVDANAQWQLQAGEIRVLDSLREYYPDEIVDALSFGRQYYNLLTRRVDNARRPPPALQLPTWLRVLGRWTLPEAIRQRLARAIAGMR